MADFQQFNVTDANQMIVGIIFYGIALVSAFLSIATVYVLIRYGRSKAIGFIVSVVYGIIYTALFSAGVHFLNAIK